MNCTGFLPKGGYLQLKGKRLCISRCIDDSDKKKREIDRENGRLQLFSQSLRLSTLKLFSARDQA